MRRLAPLTIEAQIAERGHEYDDTIIPWMDVSGTVHAATTRPIRVPLYGLGMDYVDDLVVPIAPISGDYPLGRIMLNRVNRWETTPWKRAAAARARDRAEAASELEAMDHELRRDLRNLFSERLWFGAGK